jgi:hypothetical protein
MGFHEGEIMQSRVRLPGVLFSGLIWVGTYLAARVVLKEPRVTGVWRLVTALLPVGPFALFLVALSRGIRQLDELERRIQLEALALAFPLTMLLLMALGLLELAIPLPREDWSYRHVWAMLPLFYFVGLALARRRYA